MAEADVQSIVQGLAALYRSENERPWRHPTPAPVTTPYPAVDDDRRRTRRRDGERRDG